MKTASTQYIVLNARSMFRVKRQSSKKMCAETDQLRQLGGFLKNSDVYFFNGLQTCIHNIKPTWNQDETETFQILPQIFQESFPAQTKIRN